MFLKFLKLIKFLGLRLKSQTIWGPPPQAAIAILDENSHEWLVDLLRGREFAIVGNPGKVFYINKGIVRSFINWFFKTDHPAVAYAIALLESIQPKIVITIIDNSSFFYEVSRHCKGPRFLAIQNANRVDTVFMTTTEARKIHIPEYACYGEYERELYTQVGAAVGKFYPVGSLRDALYREKRREPGTAKKYDVCVVSEGGPGADKEWFPGIEKSMLLIVEHAIRFCEEQCLRLCIAGKRSDPDDFNTEKEWFTRNLGRDVPLIKSTRFEFTTWGLIDQSAVSLAQCSTALREGMGRGNRVLFCNYSNNAKLDFPVDGLWFLKDPSYEAFEQRMLTLLGMSDREFQDKAAATTKYIINYNPEYPTTKFLADLIAEAAGA